LSVTLLALRSMISDADAVAGTANAAKATVMASRRNRMV
jgi:hypothetical protein